MSAALREQVALACRMIALEGYVDLTLGHVSVREPDTSTIWIKRKSRAASSCCNVSLCSFTIFTTRDTMVGNN